MSENRDLRSSMLAMRQRENNCNKTGKKGYMGSTYRPTRTKGLKGTCKPTRRKGQNSTHNAGSPSQRRKPYRCERNFLARNNDMILY